MAHIACLHQFEGGFILTCVYKKRWEKEKKSMQRKLVSVMVVIDGGAEFVSFAATPV